MGIEFLQNLHLPLSRIKLIMGMLSIVLIGVLHFGHLEDGIIMDKPLGILYMHTLRNEPIAKPKIIVIK